MRRDIVKDISGIAIDTVKANEKDVIDKYFLFMVGLAYGVCDIICILFFCPFQTWFMKNRCCTTCRIYNWDFAMLCTPFLLIPGFYNSHCHVPMVMFRGYGEDLPLFLGWSLLHRSCGG